MRILLLGNYANDRLESMERFRSALEERIRARGLDVSTIRPPVIFGRLRRSAAGVGKWLGYLDKFLLFPVLLRTRLRSQAERCDLVVHICDHSNAIYTRYLSRIPHLVTCHDLLAIRSASAEFPENPTAWSGRIYQRMILRGLQHAQCIASVSHSTARDLQRLTGRSAGADLLILNGLNFPYAPMGSAACAAALQRLEPRLTTTPYVLHVGGNQWYKNRMAVARIYQQLRARSTLRPALVFAGQPPGEDVRSFLARHGLGADTIAVGRCSNEDLLALYSGAAALLFPSIAEGFGWPIIEAQACGCPVMTARAEPMSEVGGHAAVTIDPKDPAGAAQRLEELLLESPVARNRRRAWGIENAGRYSLDRMTDSYLAAYATVLAGRHP